MPSCLAEATANEPVGRFQRWLVDSLGVSEDTLAAIDAKAVAAIDAAIDEAKASPPPDLSELQTDIFSNQEAVPQ